MALKINLVEYYKDRKKEYRWRFRAKNGKILARSSEGYKNMKDCEACFTIIRLAFFGSKVPKR